MRSWWNSNKEFINDEEANDHNTDTYYEPKKAKNIYRNQYDDTTQKFNGPRLLFMVWKGSCYKLIWGDFVIFCVMYAIISFFYRYLIFHDAAKRQFFELLCIYADRFSAIIPISFLTGFYVTQVVARWWDQFMSLPWPDRLALKLANFCPGAVSEYCC